MSGMGFKPMSTYVCGSDLKSDALDRSATLTDTCYALACMLVLKT